MSCSGRCALQDLLLRLPGICHGQARRMWMLILQRGYSKISILTDWSKDTLATCPYCSACSSTSRSRWWREPTTSPARTPTAPRRACSASTRWRGSLTRSSLTSIAHSGEYEVQNDWRCVQVEHWGFNGCCSHLVSFCRLRHHLPHLCWHKITGAFHGSDRLFNNFKQEHQIIFLSLFTWFEWAGQLVQFQK